MLYFHIWTFLGTPVHPFFKSCANCVQCFSLSDCIVISQELFLFLFLAERNFISAKIKTKRPYIKGTGEKETMNPGTFGATMLPKLAAEDIGIVLPTFF